VSPSLQRSTTSPQVMSNWVTTGGGLAPSDRAGEGARQPGIHCSGPAHDTKIDQLLSHGLIAGDLRQPALAEQVAAAVSHLEQVGSGPDTEIEGEW